MHNSQVVGRTLIKISSASVILLSVLHAYTTAAQQVSPIDVVDGYCRLDTNGRRINLNAQKDLAPLLLDARSLAQHSELGVVKDYSLRELGVQDGVAEVAIDYHILARLDSSFRFTRQQVAHSMQPVLQSETISLVLSDTYFDLGSDGQWRKVKGVPEWRIKKAPSEPHVNAAAAIAYVRAESYRSKDPLVKMNAQKTLAELQSLYQSQSTPGQPIQPIQQSPVAVLTQFTEMETDGVGLTPQGLRQLNAFLVQPAQRHRVKIRVARAFAVKESTFLGNKANLYVEYAALGELDSALRFTELAPATSIVRQDFSLLFDDKYLLPAHGTEAGKEIVGPSRWRIEDAHPEQWLTVSAAIRYVTEMRNATTDPTVKANAEKTLASLARYR